MTIALFCAWGALYLLNVGLGFLTGAAGLVKAALIVLALLSFVPGVMLLLRGNRKITLTVRWISIAVLGLTTVLLVAFFLCAAFAPAPVVNVIFSLLALVSAPMLSGQYWILGLFLWACLLSATFLKK